MIAVEIFLATPILISTEYIYGIAGNIFIPIYWKMREPKSIDYGLGLKPFGDVFNMDSVGFFENFKVYGYSIRILKSQLI